MSANKQTYTLESIPRASVLQRELGDYQQMRESLLADLAPQGGLETAVFEQILHATWDQRRFSSLQFALVYHSEQGTRDVDPLLSGSTVERALMLERLLRQADQRFRRSLQELRRVQTERAVRKIETNAQDATPVTGVADSAKIARARRAQARANSSASSPQKKPAAVASASAPPAQSAATAPAVMTASASASAPRTTPATIAASKPPSIEAQKAAVLS